MDEPDVKHKKENISATPQTLCKKQLNKEQKEAKKTKRVR